METLFPALLARVSVELEKKVQLFLWVYGVLFVWFLELLMATLKLWITFLLDLLHLHVATKYCEFKAFFVCDYFKKKSRVFFTSYYSSKYG